jgi:DNA uptake protein ComE-like DNA-binding protein
MIFRVEAVADILNTANRSELMSVNGIGKGTATRIMKHRPYESAEQVLQEGVLPEETLERVKEQLIDKNSEDKSRDAA